MQIKIPNYISLAISMLEAGGYAAYVVGGCVRDVLLNKEPNDWDICTSALPEQTMEVFKDYKLVTSGVKHGTVCVIINHLPVEITTFRIDGEYKDNRRPDSITFTLSLSEDLKRRDFTINAMAYSEKSGLVDLNGGITDLNNQTIRCVGDAGTRFDEDALRIMRALRFSAQLGFNIDKSTQNAILKKKELLRNISAERITDEFTKLVLSDNYYKVLNEYKEVIRVFLPCFDTDFKDIVTARDIRLRLALALSSSRCSIEDIFGILRLPKAIKSQVKVILENKNSIITPDKYEIKKYLSVFGKELFGLILSFKTYCGEDVTHQQQIFNNILKNSECYSIRQLDISGNDILKLGLDNRQDIGKILDYLLDEVMSGLTQNDKNSLLAKAKEYASRHFC